MHVLEEFMETPLNQRQGLHGIYMHNYGKYDTEIIN